MREGRLEQGTVKLVFSILTATALALLFLVDAYKAKPARAHDLGYTAVRGGNIRYADGPDFNYIHARYWAVSQWNRLNGVPILKGTASTDRDLAFRQKRWVSDTQAYYDWRPPDVDQIWFNRYQMDKFGRYDREAVAVHEVGHALRLAHPPRTRYWYNRSIMWWDAKASRFHSWQKHDKRDYYNYW